MEASLQGLLHQLLEEMLRILNCKWIKVKPLAIFQRFIKIDLKINNKNFWGFSFRSNPYELTDGRWWWRWCWPPDGAGTRSMGWRLVSPSSVSTSLHVLVPLRIMRNKMTNWLDISNPDLEIRIRFNVTLKNQKFYYVISFTVPINFWYYVPKEYNFCYCLQDILPTSTVLDNSIHIISCPDPQ